MIIIAIHSDNEINSVHKSEGYIQVKFNESLIIVNTPENVKKSLSAIGITDFTLIDKFLEEND